VLAGRGTTVGDHDSGSARLADDVRLGVASDAVVEANLRHGDALAILSPDEGDAQRRRPVVVEDRDELVRHESRRRVGYSSR
jgi:hypothetical protein